jgi:peptide deformylase
MAIRNIVKQGDPVLGKVCRAVTEFDERLWQLLDDMDQTLQRAGGVGLAAPQVGVLRRLFIMDIEGKKYEVINPEILETSGVQQGTEGCLSCPGEWGVTRRPRRVRIKAQDRFGKWYILTGKDLLARCICHENDHLDGILFKQRVIGPIEKE